MSLEDWYKDSYSSIICNRENQKETKYPQTSESSNVSVSGPLYVLER